MTKYTYNGTETYHKLSPKIREEIIEKHFKKRISQTQLAKEYGVSRRIIWKYCHAKGESPLNKNFKLDDKKIIDLYVNEKRSILQIATIIGTTTRPIYRRLKLAGIVKRPLSRRYMWEQTVPHYRLKFKIWVAKIIEADGLVCAWCKSENTFKNRLEAHHIIPVRDMETPDLLFDINNGITLCRKCHMKIHFHEHEFVDFFRQLISKRCFEDKKLG